MHTDTHSTEYIVNVYTKPAETCLCIHVLIYVCACIEYMYHYLYVLYCVIQLYVLLCIMIRMLIAKGWYSDYVRKYVVVQRHTLSSLY